MKQNEDIRTIARQKKVYLYEIADVLGVSEQTFIRWLRKEMSEKQKADVCAAINKVAAHRKESANDDD